MGRGRKKRTGRGSMDGFRPGKEPDHLRKRRAKARLGEDAGWAQEKMIDAIGDRTPEEVQAMAARWSRGLLIAAIVLALVGAGLYFWSLLAGIAVHVLTIGVAFLWYRLRKQREQLVKMAKWMRRA